MALPRTLSLIKLEGQRMHILCIVQFMALPGIEPGSPPRQRGILAIGLQGHIKIYIKHKEQRLKSLLIINSYEKAESYKSILPTLQ